MCLDRFVSEANELLDMFRWLPITLAGFISRGLAYLLQQPLRDATKINKVLDTGIEHFLCEEQFTSYTLKQAGGQTGITTCGGAKAVICLQIYEPAAQPPMKTRVG